MRLLLILVLIICPQVAFATTANYTLQTKSGNFELVLEIADTDQKREKGLMHRKALTANAGMLFKFPNEGIHSFWMKNTYIPLDLITLDASLTVLEVIKNMQPHDTTSITPKVPYKYALELGSNKYNIAPGDKLTTH